MAMIEKNRRFHPRGRYSTATYRFEGLHFLAPENWSGQSCGNWIVFAIGSGLWPGSPLGTKRSSKVPNVPCRLCGERNTIIGTPRGNVSRVRFTRYGVFVKSGSSSLAHEGEARCLLLDGETK